MSTSSLPLLLCDQLKQRCHPPYPANEAAIVEVLRALQTCSMTVDVLQSSRVGVLVNSVRRELSEEGAALAKQLIAHWKEVARNGTAKATTLTPSSIPVSGSVTRSSPARSASDALRATSERRKRKADDMTRAASPQSAVSPPYTISDLPSAAYTQQLLCPARAATYYRDTAAAPTLPLYNPNHHSQQPQTSKAAANAHLGEDAADGGGSGGEKEEDEIGDVDRELDLTAKRKRDHSTDVDMVGSHYLPLPTSAVAVCSLQQMCVDHLAQPTVVNQLSSLPPLPQPLLLAILQRAGVQCLRRVQAGSGWIKEADLDELWKAAAMRRWGKQEVEAEEHKRGRTQQQNAAGSSWRAFYDKKEKDKESKLSQLGLRLKARVEEEKKEKKEKAGIKSMDIRQVTKQMEKRGKRQPTSVPGGGSADGSSGAVSRSNSNGHSSSAADKRADKSSNRLSALRKESGGLSQRFWSARPND